MNGPLAARAPANARLLFPIGLAAVAAACCYYALTTDAHDPVQLYQGLVILTLAATPGLIWAKRGGSDLPLFEVLMLTTANTYALPLLSGQNQLRMFDPGVISSAGMAVILYQSIALFVYQTVAGQPGRSSFFRDEVVSRDIGRYIGYGLVLTTAYTFVATYFDVLPRDLVGVLRAVFYGVGIVSAFVQARRWGQGELTRRERTLFSVNLGLQVAIQFSTLFLVGGISLLVLALVGFVSGSQRVPLFTTLFVLALVALLHNGKGNMRMKYWEQSGVRHQATPLQVPALFAEWIQSSLERNRQLPTDESMTTNLLERTSLFHILCLVVSRTPDPLPYLDGITYADTPGQLIPRFFWPDKPAAHVSTYRLSIYYGLQRMEDTGKTTIGFGMLAEAYANYGMFGTGILGAFLGFLYKRLHTLCKRSPLLSYAGLLQIVVMAWSFQTEYPMSMWLSSMAQAVAAVVGLPFLIRNLLR